MLKIPENKLHINATSYYVNIYVRIDRVRLQFRNIGRGLADSGSQHLNP